MEDALRVFARGLCYPPPRPQEEQRLKLAALRREEAALTAELTAFDARLETWEARP